MVSNCSHALRPSYCFITSMLRDGKFSQMLTQSIYSFYSGFQNYDMFGKIAMHVCYMLIGFYII